MKKIIFIMITCGIVVILTSCNYDIIDTQFRYQNAMIQMPDGAVIEGEVEKWRDYEDGDQIQVKIEGKTYLVHSENVCLIGE